MTTQELSSSGVRRRQEQSVAKQRGIMHSYIEFAHVVCLVALPEHHCVQWVPGDIFFAVIGNHVNVLYQHHVCGSAMNKHMHNLVELVIGVFVELVQVCFNLLRHIRRRRRGLGPGQNVVKHCVVTVFVANTSWTPSHSSPESSEAMIAQSSCLCSSPRSRCCLCSSPRRRCQRSRCCLCSSPRRRCSRCRRGQRGLPRLCRGSAHGETDLTTGELDRRSWQRVCVCSTVLSLGCRRGFESWRLLSTQNTKYDSKLETHSEYTTVMSHPILQFQTPRSHTGAPWRIHASHCQGGSCPWHIHT